VARLHIVKFGDPVLRRVADSIDGPSPELNKLIDDMAQTMYEAPGIGLAAPQVGVSKRLFVCDPDFREDRKSRNLRVFINPKFVGESVEDASEEEGCLSLPGLRGKVYRADRVRVQALDRNFKPFEVSVSGLFARVLQHENDHLDGKMFFDSWPEARRQTILGHLARIGRVSQQDSAEIKQRGLLNAPYPLLASDLIPESEFDTSDD